LDVPHVWVSLYRAQKLLPLILPNHSREKQQAVMHKLEEQSSVGPIEAPSTSGGETGSKGQMAIGGGMMSRHRAQQLATLPRVEHVTLLEILMLERLEQDEKEDQAFAQLFTLADKDGNGELEWEEFEVLVRDINPSLSSSEISGMFREAVEEFAFYEDHPEARDEGAITGLLPAVFSVVAREHKLQQYLVVTDDGSVELIAKIFQKFAMVSGGGVTDKEWAIGDQVKVTKVSSSFRGQLGRIKQPNWTGRVKVVMDSNGSTKSYLASELQNLDKPSAEGGNAQEQSSSRQRLVMQTSRLPEICKELGHEMGEEMLQQAVEDMDGETLITFDEWMQWWRSEGRMELEAHTVQPEGPRSQ
jgi:Ca2+-binding EF-hand superfamily protein